MFFTYILSNVHNFMNNDHRILIFSVVILDRITEGTMSQIFSLGPRSFFFI